MTGRKIMTLDEVNALIPELTQRITSILEKREKYALQHDQIFMEELLTQAERHRGIPVKEAGMDKEFRGLEASLEDLEVEMEELRRRGILVRSFEPVAVDILGFWEGDQVYYCWRRGDTKVRGYRMLRGSSDEVFPLPEA